MNRYTDYKEFNDALDNLIGSAVTADAQSALRSEEKNTENNCKGMGKLIVQVSTANGALPIQNASVTVSDVSGSIISSQLTDNSGRTSAISLCAPPASYSQSPGNTMTYDTYNIKVEKSGYYTEEFLNVAVFDKIESIQPVALEPLGENSFSNDRSTTKSSSADLDIGANTSNVSESGNTLIIKENPRPAVADSQNNNQ